MKKSYATLEEIQKALMPKKSKMGNVKTVVDGIEFDSAAESRRYSELNMLEKAGEIRDLKLQVRIELQPGFKPVGSPAIRAIVYVADFTYSTKAKNEIGGWFLGDFVWSPVIEDHKGHKTKDYLLKKKMLLYLIYTGRLAAKFLETKAGR